MVMRQPPDWNRRRLVPPEPATPRWFKIWFVVVSLVGLALGTAGLVVAVHFIRMWW